MNINLEQVPFSTAGSYLAISLLPANFRGRGNPAGLYLRTVRGAASTPLVCRLALVRDGKELASTCRATPHELVLEGEGGKASLCFADAETLLVKGEKAGLMLDFLSGPNAIFDFIYDVPCEDHLRRMADCFKNNIRLLAWAQEGESRVEQEWLGSTAAGCRLVLEGDNLLAAIREIATEWDGACQTYRYEDCLRAAKDRFLAFREAMPSVPSRFADAAETAAYVNWSGYVKASGFLTRDSMYMSKNWMCNVWSWDHCFNAMALAYHLPEEAWNQFILLFDYQHPTGAIPDSVNDSKIIWNYCKPPIHGWALSRMMEVMELSIPQMEEAYDKLGRWTEWWLNNRDHDGDGVCEYTHGNDSGWDNSTAFSQVPPVETPDLQAFLVLQMETLADLARRLGRHSAAKRWEAQARSTLEAMLKHCFRDGRPRSVHSMSHEEIPNQSLILYLPIILGDRLPEEIRNNLLEDLRGAKFLTPHGYATESPASPLYEPDGYWRGPIWAPSTMILLDGLHRCGEHGLVEQVAEAFSRMVRDSGCAENFDALTGEGLRDRAYTWTASAFLVMAHNYLK